MDEEQTKKQNNISQLQNSLKELQNKYDVLKRSADEQQAFFETINDQKQLTKDLLAKGETLEIESAGLDFDPSIYNVNMEGLSGKQAAAHTVTTTVSPTANESQTKGKRQKKGESKVDQPKNSKTSLKNTEQ